MKVWHGYGSEHSANLVMIGHFKTEEAATQVNAKLNAIAAQVAADDGDEDGAAVFGTGRFSTGMLDLLVKIRVHSLRPAELEQFLYEIDWKPDGKDVVVTTDEYEVSALMKVMLDEGARVEVYSAHVHSGTGRGRGA